MEEKLKSKVADWGAFLAAVFVILANPVGILGATGVHARAAYSTTKRWGWELRTIVGEVIAWPVVWFYLGAVASVDALGFATLKAVPATPEILNHWTRGFVWWAMGVGTVVMLLHVGDIIWARYTHPAKMPLAKGAIAFHVWLRIMGFAVVAHAISASCELALIPAVGLVIVVLATAYVAALALGWMAQKAIEIIEAGGTAVAAPLAAFPIITVENVKKFADFFKNEAWRTAPLKVAVDEATVHAIFLLLVSFWPTPAWATIVGVPVYATGAFGIIAKLNGSADKVKERREALVWRLYKWSPLVLLAARLIAEIPKVQELWKGLLGFVSVTLGWSTNTLKGEFKNPIPSMEVWFVLLMILIASITAMIAWKWSSEWSKWGKAALRAPAGMFFGLMLLFGLPNATCGVLKGCGKDDEKSEAKEVATEQKEEKRQHTAPPRQAVATPPTPSATAPAKHPSKMSQAELNARLADIAARRKR